MLLGLKYLAVPFLLLKHFSSAITFMFNFIDCYDSWNKSFFITISFFDSNYPLLFSISTTSTRAFKMVGRIKKLMLCYQSLFCLFRLTSVSVNVISFFVFDHKYLQIGITYECDVCEASLLRGPLNRRSNSGWGYG